jgi:hypothetical protein
VQHDGDDRGGDQSLDPHLPGDEQIKRHQRRDDGAADIDGDDGARPVLHDRHGVLHAEEFDGLVGHDPLLRQLGDWDVEIAADQGCEQQQHGGSRTDAQVQIGAAQRAEDEKDQQNEENADKNGKEAGRQRQVVELAHLHRWCSRRLT